MDDLNPAVCNLSILETLTGANANEMANSYNEFSSATASIIGGDFSAESLLLSSIVSLSNYGLSSLLEDSFLTCLEENFEESGANKFWQRLDPFKDVKHSSKSPVYEVGDILCSALEEVSHVKEHQEQCLLLFSTSLQSCSKDPTEELNKNAKTLQSYLFSRYNSMVYSVLMTGLPRNFPDVLHCFFMRRLEELSSYVNGKMNVDDNEELPTIEETYDETDNSCTSFPFKLTKDNNMIKQIGKVVCQLRSLGFTSMTESAYASAIFFLLKAKVHDVAGDDYSISVLQSLQNWIHAVPLQFLQALLAYVKDSNAQSIKESVLSDSSEGTTKWRLRFEYYAYETLQDLRISKLFEIIVDYPESSPAIEDLKKCLEYTGQHAKLVDSFTASLKVRLLTAGASTNDILHQYVSTIKALRTIDPTGIFLEAVGEPIKEYLRGRKDTIKCIVTMLTDGSSGNPNASGTNGDSLLEELNRDEENQVEDDDGDFHTDEKQAWINCMRWEPDPVEADPYKGSRNRRKVDILGVLVGVIGSREQLVNEYRMMLAEKLLNKSDYDIDSEIRILELLKIHFGEGSMQKCEIMLNDMIESKRTNHNIKAIIKQSPKDTELNNGFVLENVSSTIISTNFWPPIQEEAFTLPKPVENLLSEYAKKYHQLKTPRKLQLKKNLGIVKLELQFEDRAYEFTVTPIQAAIIMHFQDQPRWPFDTLAATLGVPVDVLQRRISFWVTKGIIVESENQTYTLNETSESSTRHSVDEVAVGEEDDTSAASSEEQLHNEMAVFERFILGMLTNFGGMALDRIHNTLKMFCVADPPYDKSIQQLQSFLSGLVSDEKLLLRDGLYVMR